MITHSGFLVKLCIGYKTNIWFDQDILKTFHKNFQSKIQMTNTFLLDSNLERSMEIEFTEFQC